MPFSLRPIVAALVAVLLAAGVTGCGRTPTASVDGPDQPPDSWVPPTDGGIRPERPMPLDFGPPPPPPRDLWPPPPVDGWPPPPPMDFWPPPPPVDFWPPPPPMDFGPCVATCQQMCQLLKSCGLLPGGVGVCASQECPTWPQSQSGCLEALICQPPPTPDICPLVKQCLVTPPPPPLQADLTITDFSAQVSGSTVTYTIKTCNQGQAPSGNFFVDVYYDQPTAPGLQEFGDQYNNYSNGLAAGACNTTVFTRSNTPGGSYSSWAQVDADGIVQETDESNNIAGPLQVTVTGPPPPNGPDLVIQNVETQTYGYTSITVRYRVTICNNGTAPSGSTEVHVYYDSTVAPVPGQVGDNTTTVSGLAPGTCTNRNIYRTGTPAGTYSSWAQVDPANTVAEADETNNVYGPVKVTVGTTAGADLTIQSLTSTIILGNTVRYRIQVCNVGTGAAGATQVHVYYDTAAAPKQGDIGDKYTYVTSLQPGDCTYRDIYRNATPQGTYTSWAQIDPLNVVTETDENNNVHGPITVTVGGGTTGCSAICAFAISCGVFQPSQLQQCLTWCQGLTTSAKQCVSAATQNGSCADFKACNTPPPPPPPPPPGVCPDLCTYLINSCNLLPSNQYWTCIGACENLTPDKIQCAQDAKAKGQCMQIVLCMF